VPFRFVVLADVQYADRDPAGRRNYRASLAKLEQAVNEARATRPAFTIHLGDLVDGGTDSIDRILPLFDRLPGPRYHVLGNRDFVGPRRSVLRNLGLARPYYSFRIRGWTFLVLDGMNVSVTGGWPEDSPNYRAGAEILARLKQQGAPNAHEWNGAVGEEQCSWLETELEAAHRRGERAVVFCHFPTLAAACRPEHLLWDHAEVLAVLDRQPAVAAYMNGHDHSGGYALRQGVHHVTVAGVVENDLAKCLRVVDLTSGSFRLTR
jgi:3',5'-cyclic AMP phosphodiesterase CpdA